MRFDQRQMGVPRAAARVPGKPLIFLSSAGRVLNMRIWECGIPGSLESYMDVTPEGAYDLWKRNQDRREAFARGVTIRVRK